MRARLKHTHVGEWPAIALENDALQLLAIPELGGKIVSLKSQCTGREWLWSNPHLPLAKPPDGATNFGLHDTGGWDEIFPTVDPCSVPDSAWGDRQLTDHGELWYRPWQVIDKQVDEDSVGLTLAVEAAELPFRFERTLSLSGQSTLEIHYEVINLTDQPLPYLWAAHPLISIHPGDEIRLPTNTHVSSTGWVNLALAEENLPFAWPHLRLANGRTIDFSVVPCPDANFAIKLFAENISPSSAGIFDHRSGECLTLTFSNQISHCGLWLNCGAWSGAGTPPYFNLGIEPTTSPHDNLFAAWHKKLSPAVPPLLNHQWHFRISIQ